MRDNSINWYAPSEVKVSHLSNEEIEPYKKRKAEHIKKKLKDGLTRNKVLKLDIDGYVKGVIDRNQRRTRR